MAASRYSAALDDPMLEAVLSELYEHYENPASWHVAPGAKEAFAALRRGGVKAGPHSLYYSHHTITRAFDLVSCFY